MPPAVVTPVQFQNQKKMLSPNFTDMKLNQIQIEDTWHLSENIARSFVSLKLGFRMSGGCFTNVSRVLQNIPSKIAYCRYCTSYNNFKFKLCTCAQSHMYKFQLEKLIINVFSGIVYFHMIMFESSWMLVKQPQDPWFVAQRGEYWKSSLIFR